MINAIKINLNHASSKAARLETRREQLRWAAFGSVLLLLLANLTWLFIEISQYSDLISQKENQIDEIQHEIDVLKQEGMDLSRNDIVELSKLEGNRKLWAEKLQALGLLIPHDMALTNLDFKSNALVIQGVSRIYPDEREFDIIEEFIERLKSSKTFSSDFEDIKFSKYARMTVMLQDVVNFEIRATLKSLQKKKKKLRSRRS